MIDTSSNHLWEEIKRSIDKRDRHLDTWENQLQAYTGPWYNSKGPSTKYDPENTSYEYLSHLIPRMVYDNPRVSVSTRRPTAQQDVAEAIEWGLNRWCRDVDIKSTLQELGVDYGFRWAVAMVTEEPRPGDNMEAEDPPMWPQVTRISPWDFGWDANAPSYKKARLAWHRWTIDKEDLEQIAKEDEEKPEDEQQGWNYRAVSMLPTGTDYADDGPDSRRKDNTFRVDRDQVTIYEIWIPEIQLDGEPGPDEGFHGTIYTIGAGQNLSSEEDAATSMEVREPRPFFGPRWGPYTLIGTYSVPDQSEPLATLVATAGQDEQLNRQARAVDQANEKFKNLIGVAGEEPDLQEQISAGRDLWVYPFRNVRDLNSQVKEFTVGGASPEQIATLQLLYDRRNRILGMDDVQRGTIEGDGTATEVTAAVAASENRIGYVIHRFQDGVQRILNSIAWYLYHDDRIIFPLGKEAGETFEIPPGTDVWFMGGSFDDESGATFDDLELAIEMYSMERASEATQRRKSAFVLEMLTTLGPLVPQLEAIGWKMRPILDQIGDNENIPELSSLYNWERGAEIAGLAQPEPSSPFPQLGRQAGRMGAFLPSYMGETKAQTVQQDLGRGRVAGLPSLGLNTAGGTQPQFEVA